MPALAVAGAAVVGGVMSSRAQKKAGQAAADAQVQSSEAAIAEQQRQFDAIQALLKPYVDAGAGALGGQQDLAGLNGAAAQRTAIDAINSSPELQALMQQGETGILQNASATGGLRGGNVQGALAQFRPAMLAAALNDQYGRLGGLAQMGQNSAAMQGSLGQASTSNVTNLLQQQGAALAGGALASGRAQAGAWNALGSGVGLFGGLGGFNPASAPAPAMASGFGTSLYHGNQTFGGPF